VKRSTTTPTPATSTAEAVLTRSRTKPQIRRSSRSNIGKVDRDGVYYPTFESDLAQAKVKTATPKKSNNSSSGRASGKAKSAKQPKEQVSSFENYRGADLNHSTVQVRTKSSDGTMQTYEADHVIVTVPLGILQIPCDQPGHITFSPPLPQYKRDSINKAGFGHYNKCALAFPYRFWDEQENDDFWGVAAAADDKLGVSILAVDLGRAHKKNTAATGLDQSVDGNGDIPVMLLIFGGAYASTMESLTDEQVVGEAMDVIREAWGSKVEHVPNPIDYAVTRWGQDKYTRGSFSFVQPGADGYVEALKISRPIFDPYPAISSSGGKGTKPSRRQQRESQKRPVILFAGEHSTSFHPSTLHGAYLSGIREAYRLDLTLEPGMNRNIEFDKKCIYDRTFDMSWKSIGPDLVRERPRKKQRAGAAPKKGAEASAITSLEDVTLLRGVDTHGSDTRGIGIVATQMFPMPVDNGTRKTGKGLARRYDELEKDGCNAAYSSSSSKVVSPNDGEDLWLVASGDDRDEEEYWDEAAAIEADHIASYTTSSSTGAKS